MDEGSLLFDFGEWFNTSLEPVIANFVKKNASAFQIADIKEEQPIANLELFGKYKALIEEKVNAWVTSYGETLESFAKQMDSDSQPFLTMTGIMEYEVLHELMKAQANGEELSILSVIGEGLDDDIDELFNEEVHGLKPDKRKH